MWSSLCSYFGVQVNPLKKYCAMRIMRLYYRILQALFIPITDKNHVLLKEMELWDRWVVADIRKNMDHIACPCRHKIHPPAFTICVIHV